MHALLGGLAWRDGRLDDAERSFLESVRAAADIGYYVGLRDMLFMLAALAAQTGHAARGAMLLGAADSLGLREAQGKWPMATALESSTVAMALRKALGEERFASRYTAARMLRPRRGRRARARRWRRRAGAGAGGA